MGPQGIGGARSEARTARHKAVLDILPSLDLTVAAYAEWEGIPTAPRRGIELPLSRFGGFLLLAA